MKLLKVGTLALIGCLVVVILVNLVTLGGGGRCVCSLCLGRCAEQEEVPLECPPQASYGIDCILSSCKYFAGKCFRFPKMLDLSLYLPGQVKEDCMVKTERGLLRERVGVDKAYESCLSRYKYHNCEAGMVSSILIKWLVCPRLDF